MNAEVYVRLSGAQLSWRSRAHFFDIAARGTRREVVDYARKKPKIQLIPLDGLPPNAIASGSNWR